jgi:hypothetical protein
MRNPFEMLIILGGALKRATVRFAMDWVLPRDQQEQVQVYDVSDARSMIAQHH